MVPGRVFTLTGMSIFIKIWTIPIFTWCTPTGYPRVCQNCLNYFITSSERGVWRTWGQLGHTSEKVPKHTPQCLCFIKNWARLWVQKQTAIASYFKSYLTWATTIAITITQISPPRSSPTINTFPFSMATPLHARTCGPKWQAKWHTKCFLASNFWNAVPQILQTSNQTNTTNMKTYLPKHLPKILTNGIPDPQSILFFGIKIIEYTSS